MENKRELIWVRIGGIAAILFAVLRIQSGMNPFGYTQWFVLVSLTPLILADWAFYLYLRQFDNTNTLKYALAAFAIGFGFALFLFLNSLWSFSYEYLIISFINISLGLFAYSSFKAKTVPKLVSWSGLLGNFFEIVFSGIIVFLFVSDPNGSVYFSYTILWSLLFFTTILQAIFLAGMGVRILFPKAKAPNIRIIITEWYQSRAFWIGFVGWFAVNGLVGWLVTQDRYGSLSILLLFLMPANIIAMVVFAFKRRLFAFGLLSATSINLVIVLILGTMQNAICFVPFFIDFTLF